MNPKLKKTIIVLRISSIIYFLLGILFITFLSIGSGIMTVVLIGMGTFIEIVIRNLKRNKYWAWIAGIVVCSLYLTSMLFIVLGIIGLMGLLNKEVRKEFSKGTSRKK